MKYIKYIKYLCAFIVSIFILTGCLPQTNQESEAPAGKESTDTATEENKIEEGILKALLDENENCMQNIFALSSLPHTEEEVAPNIYAVDEAYFKSYEDFENYIRSVYCKEEADRLLYDYPYEGDPKYINTDGRLCVNINLDGAKGYYVDWTDYKLTIKEADANKCSFSVTGQIEEPAENPIKEDYTLESTAVFENGKWLLSEMIY